MILAHIPAKLLSWSEINLYSFEIFQDDVRLPLGFGLTESRSIQYANTENYISTKHVDSALFAIRKMSQLKSAILFPASKLYSLGYPPVQNLAPVFYASTVTWYDVVSEGN